MLPPRIPIKVRKKPNPGSERISHKPEIASADQRPLTGYIHGKVARKDEERFYYALAQVPSIEEVIFRKILGAPPGLPGQIELDFLIVQVGRVRAFEIDDNTFIHKGAGAKAEEHIKDGERVLYLRRQGYNVMDVEHVDAALLGSDEDAQRTVNMLFGR